jgi:hypothetical protein
MRFLYNFEYNKLKLKEVVLLIPKNHSSLNSMLTPALALYGISVKEFLTEFEKLTIHLEYDLIVPVVLKITKIKTFEINLKTVSLNNIVRTYNLFSESKLFSNVLFIYKLLLLKSVQFNYCKPTINAYKNLKNYLCYFEFTQKLRKKLNNNSVMLQNKEKVYYPDYGIWFNFPNVNNNYLVYLKSSADLYNIRLKKIIEFFQITTILY